MLIKLGRNSLTPGQIARMCGGKIIREGKTGSPVSSVCVDSRDAREGSLFLAVRGARTDGHRYLAAAASAGASAALIDRLPEAGSETMIPEKSGMALILTDSTVSALGRLAAAYSRGNCPRRVAVTGSVGKTSTKEMCRAVLSEGLSGVYASEGNLNTPIGMPLSLLAAPEGAGTGIFEMGLEEPGEISSMSKICGPEAAAVTVLGSSHLEHIGSRGKLAAEKLSVKDGLSRGGLLLLPADEPLFAATLESDPRARGFAVRESAGDGKMADYTAINVRNTGNVGGGLSEAGLSFDMMLPDGSVINGLHLAVPGRHNVGNALIACALGSHFGLDGDTIRRGLASYRPVGMRQQITVTGGVTLINDCYNASPESMKAACLLLCGDGAGGARAGKRKGRKIALLGDMYELGSDSRAMHRDVGAFFASHGTDVIVTLGSLASDIADGARSAAAEGGCDIIEFPDRNDASAAASALAEIIRPGDTVLIKASRAVGAERAAAALTELLSKGEPSC